VKVGALIGVVITALGTAVGMTVLWLAMRSVMSLGGFVAQGGPYVIAHLAPDWVVWLLPGSIVGLVVCMVASQELNSTFETPSLMLVAWSMLFLSLGWNFLEFGLRAPGGGLSVGWLICAAAFFAMGGGGLYALWQAVRVGWEFDGKKTEKTGVPARPGFVVYFVATAIAAAVGILLGVLLFRVAAG
jgi:hypothetical protein